MSTASASHSEHHLPVIGDGLVVYLSQTTQSAVCYDIESAIGRNPVRRSLTTEGAVRFLKKREPDHFVVARGGKALYTGREFLTQHDGGWEGT